MTGVSDLTATCSQLYSKMVDRPVAPHDSPSSYFNYIAEIGSSSFDRRQNLDHSVVPQYFGSPQTFDPRHPYGVSPPSSAPPSPIAPVIDSSFAERYRACTVYQLTLCLVLIIKTLWDVRRTLFVGRGEFPPMAHVELLMGSAYMLVTHVLVCLQPKRIYKRPWRFYVIPYGIGLGLAFAGHRHLIASARWCLLLVAVWAGLTLPVPLYYPRVHPE